MRIVIAIHDLPVWTIPAGESRRIAAALPDDEVIDVRDEAARSPAIATADVVFAARLSAAEFDQAARLRWVHSPAVGVGSILSDALVKSAVAVSNSRGIHSEAIAEHAIALMLALRRRLHIAVRRQEERQWAQAEISAQCSPPLSETSLLVVGLGTIGARVAGLASGLGLRVTGIRRRVDQPPPPGVAKVLPISRLREALREADVVVLTLPGTRETRALIGSAELAAMKASAILVNVSRGALIDEQALVRALSERRITAAGLDAFQQEPLPAEHPFWGQPNVLLSPHTAVFAGAFWPPVVDLFLENLGRFKRCDALMNPVDKQAGY
jgi:phosphoglycerate dehydrogenase-like enzyme